MTNRRRETLPRALLALAFVPSIGGCVAYRLVGASETEWTYALYANDRKVPDTLRTELEARCSGPFRVVHEGAVQVGEAAAPDISPDRQGPELLGHETMDPTRKLEWHVTLACGSSAPPGAASSAPAPSQEK
jgi:hypothetical protein